MEAVMAKGKKSKVLRAGDVVIDPAVPNETPLAPSLTLNDIEDTIFADSPLGISEIVYSENSGAYQQYPTGGIIVGNVDRPSGYYKFKIKAAQGRNESAVVSSLPFTAKANIIPAAPTLNPDDAANTLSASSPLGISEILVSENGGAFIAYTGTINVGNVARPAGYWNFKIKAASGRSESAVAASPAFTAVSSSISPNTYVIPSQSTVSGAVYRKSDNVMVRTLFSGERKSAGSYPIKWDGTDDFSNPLPNVAYYAKYLANNVQYINDGIIGNNSISGKSNEVHASLDPLTRLVIVGTKAHFVVGYNEAKPSHSQFDLANPKLRISPFDYIGNQTTDFIATDGVNIYLTAFDNYQNANSFVYAYKISDNSIVPFSAGVPFKVKYGNQFNNVIGFSNAGAADYPSGLAVSANHIFIPRKGSNRITVLDKNSGAFIRNITINQPTALAVDGLALWVCSSGNIVERKIINSDGSLGATTATLSGLSEPADIRVNGSIVYVVDAGSSNTIKAFNTSGASQWTFGKPGGSLTSPLIENDRFGFWKVNEDTRLRESYGGIAIDGSGNLWVADPSNKRVQKFNSGRAFLDAIIYQSKTYSCFIDPNDPTKLLANFIQFKVGYTNNILTDWIMQYNWEGYLNSNYNPRSFNCITTLSNGRTYCLFAHLDNVNEIVELDPVNGIRYTGVVSTINSVRMDGAGHLYGVEDNGLTQRTVWKKQTLTGFTSSNNPIYTAATVLLTAAAASTNLDPRHSGAHIRPWEKTVSNILVNFRGNIDQHKIGNDKFSDEVWGNYHLGGMNPITGEWLWKTLMTTHTNFKGEYPLDAFDAGNGIPEYAANVAMAIDKSIIWGYNGEGWKQSQVNKWSHYNENGLFIGQFGATGPEYNLDEIAYKGFAGNAFSPAITKVGQDYFLFHNDESVHGGIMRWKITGLNSINEQIVDITPSFVKGVEVAFPGIDMMANIPFDANITSNAGKWAFSPAPSGGWKVVSNAKSYSKREPNDLYLSNSNSGAGTYSAIAAFNAGTNMTDWEFKGEINFDGSKPNVIDANGLNAYFDILDNSSKIIARFHHTIQFGSPDITTIWANNTAIASGSDLTIKLPIRVPTPLSFVKSGSSIFVKYGTFNQVTLNSPFETSANLSNPAFIRILFTNNGQWNTYEKFININKWRFNNTTQMT